MNLSFTLLLTTWLEVLLASKMVSPTQSRGDRTVKLRESIKVLTIKDGYKEERRSDKQMLAINFSKSSSILTCLTTEINQWWPSHQLLQSSSVIRLSPISTRTSTSTRRNSSLPSPSQDPKLRSRSWTASMLFLQAVVPPTATIHSSFNSSSRCCSRGQAVPQLGSRRRSRARKACLKASSLT